MEWSLAIVALVLLGVAAISRLLTPVTPGDGLRRDRVAGGPRRPCGAADRRPARSRFGPPLAPGIAIPRGRHASSAAWMSGTAPQVLERRLLPVGEQALTDRAMATARTVWVASALVMTSPPSRGPNRPPPGASTPDMVSSYERRATVLRRWAIPSACGPSTCSTARGIDRQGPQPRAQPPAADHGLSPAQADHAGVVPADTRRAQSRPPPERANVHCGRPA